MFVSPMAREKTKTKRGVLITTSAISPLATNTSLTSVGREYNSPLLRGIWMILGIGVAPLGAALVVCCAMAGAFITRVANNNMVATPITIGYLTKDITLPTERNSAGSMWSTDKP